MVTFLVMMLCTVARPSRTMNRNLPLGKSWASGASDGGHCGANDAGDGDGYGEGDSGANDGGDGGGVRPV